MKSSIKYFLFALFILFVFCNLYSNSYAQCPDCHQLLTQGWQYYPPNSGHIPSASGNLDEFGIIDTSPFLVKVDNYPPIKSFPKTYLCNPPNIYYMSFDTDNNNVAPIPHNVNESIWHDVNIFREDGVGYSVSVKPPPATEVGAPDDFIMNFNTTEYDKSWDPSIPDPDFPNMVLWTWNYFVQNSIAQAFDFQGILEGPIEITAGQTTEFVANINGGSGNYGFKWEYSTNQGTNWILIKENISPIDWIYFPTDPNVPYYFYQDEYKCTFIMPAIETILKCTVSDNNSEESFVLTKTITPFPVEISFINEIESTTNFGELILDEDKNNPIQSGIPKSMNYSTDLHTIRTNELPFIYNFNYTGNTEKHLLWNFNPAQFILNHQFQVDQNIPIEMKSKFIRTDPVTLRNLLEGFEVAGSIIQFKDPWYYYKDSNDNWFQSDIFKPYGSPFSILNNSTTSYGGVFLNQDPAITPTFYSVKVDAEQIIPVNGQNRKFYFLQWKGEPDKVEF